MRISDWSSDGALPIYGMRARSFVLTLSICSAESFILTDRKRDTGVAIACQSDPNAPAPQHSLSRCVPSWYTDNSARYGEPVLRQWLFPRRAGVCAYTRSARTSRPWGRSEEHTSELQSLMRISYAVFCLKKKNKNKQYLN